MWSVITAGSGWTPNPEKDRPSSSRSRSDAQSARKAQILIVEDNRADVFLIRESIESAELNAEVHVMPDGEKAIAFLDQANRADAGRCPDLVILDINLPRRPGREVLMHLRATRCSEAPVVVVTSSNSDKDREEMAQLGVRQYFRKPSDYLEFMKLGDVLRAILLENPPRP